MAAFGKACAQAEQEAATLPKGAFTAETARWKNNLDENGAHGTMAATANGIRFTADPGFAPNSDPFMATAQFGVMVCELYDIPAGQFTETLNANPNVQAALDAWKSSGKPGFGIELPSTLKAPASSGPAGAPGASTSGGADVNKRLDAFSTGFIQAANNDKGRWWAGTGTGRANASSQQFERELKAKTEELKAKGGAGDALEKELDLYARTRYMALTTAPPTPQREVDPADAFVALFIANVGTQVFKQPPDRARFTNGMHAIGQQERAKGGTTQEINDRIASRGRALYTEVTGFGNG